MAKGIKLRNWDLDVRDYETVEDFRIAVANELAAFEHIGERFGIALVAAPAKQRVGDRYVTVGWTFNTATVPAARAVEEPEPEPLPELSEEEVAEILNTEAEGLQGAVAAPTADPYAEG